MDFTHGTPRRRYHWCLPCGILCGLMAFLTILIVGLISYIDYGGNIARFVEGDPGVARELPGPGYPGSPDPDEQLAMKSGHVDEELVVQEGQLHVRSDDPARRYAGQEQAAEHETDADEVPGAQEQRRQFKLPKLPIPTKILDLPTLIPTEIKDILSDLPVVPTNIPTDPGDIVDQLPTDPGEIISDLPIPTLPSIPAIPTLPVPIPIPTEIPSLLVPTIVPPPNKPIDSEDPLKLPDLTEIPQRVLGLLHEVVSKLSTDQNTPKYFRDILRFILRILNRLGEAYPKPTKTWVAPTLLVPTLTKLPPIIPTTLPLPTITVPPAPKFPKLPPLPRPTLTLAQRQKRQPGEDGDDTFARGGKKVGRDVGSSGAGGDNDKKPLSKKRRKQLRKAVADEVWASADWSNPLVASVTAAWAVVAFDAVYKVAEAFKATDDEAEKERLLGLLVVVDDEEIEAVA